MGLTSETDDLQPLPELVAALSETDADLVDEEMIFVFVSHTSLCSSCLTEVFEYIGLMNSL